jgi:hypothetical protein
MDAKQGQPVRETYFLGYTKGEPAGAGRVYKRYTSPEKGPQSTVLPPMQATLQALPGVGTFYSGLFV